jgi:hypothetical protein
MRYESSDLCLQKDRECQERYRAAWEGCMAPEGEKLAHEVGTCDLRRGKARRIHCLDEAVGRFSEQMEECLTGKG